MFHSVRRPRKYARNFWIAPRIRPLLLWKLSCASIGLTLGIMRRPRLKQLKGAHTPLAHRALWAGRTNQKVPTPSLSDLSVQEQLRSSSVTYRETDG